MANTASAERRARNSARKRQHNRAIKSELKSLEKRHLELAAAGKKEEAAKAFQAVSSAFDKAAKTGVVPAATASRKKSRLAVGLGKLK